MAYYTIQGFIVAGRDRNVTVFYIRTNKHYLPTIQNNNTLKVSWELVYVSDLIQNDSQDVSNRIKTVFPRLGQSAHNCDRYMLFLMHFVLARNLFCPYINARIRNRLIFRLQKIVYSISIYRNSIYNLSSPIRGFLEDSIPSTGHCNQWVPNSSPAALFAKLTSHILKYRMSII